MHEEGKLGYQAPEQEYPNFFGAIKSFVADRDAFIRVMVRSPQIGLTHYS